jgi:hypothetical protein
MKAKVGEMQENEEWLRRKRKEVRSKKVRSKRIAGSKF